MGSCAGKPKPVDGVKPEVVDQATDDSKATTLNSDSEKTIAEKNKIDATTTNGNGDKKDDEKESTRQGEETIKEPSSGNNELKTEAPAEKEKVAEEKVEEERVEEKKVEIST